MKNKILYGLWAAWYILCVGLGTIEGPEGFLKFLLVLIGLCFFVPGGLLLWDAISKENRRGVLTIRLISLGSLVLTLAAIILFFLTATLEKASAAVFYEVLILVSSPMVCCQYWIVSLFLWACLLCASFVKPQNSK